ncbi:MAG: glutathione S-transferase family protein, partial [Synechococcales cyanobacterium H12SWP_bin.12]|nr:glutathione S-transferase family protein [Synechococcales cyanobacterium H12SWP_bin.12]
LSASINLLMANADHGEGRWRLEPTWFGCDSLLDLYKLCGAPPSYRATVPVLVDPGACASDQPRLLGNDSTPLSEALCSWPAEATALNLAPSELKASIASWQELIQPSINDGVYRCGFARNQRAFDQASQALFSAVEKVEESLQTKGPWLCGERITLADVRLFPTLIRWEVVYASLFGCSAKPLWMFPALWGWRQRFFALPGVSESCDSQGWKQDYFGALFPLNPSGIVPDSPDLSRLIGAGVAQPK